MPRNLLMKRRTMKDSSTIGTVDQHRHQQSSPPDRSSVGQPSPQSDEELPSPISDDSSDSGRDSAIPGEMSHSLSFDSSRPSQLSLGSLSSASSESFLVKSPLSPFPHSMGHISLLPGILESLAVSGRQPPQQQQQIEPAQVRQLAQTPCYAEAIQPATGGQSLNSATSPQLPTADGLRDSSGGTTGVFLSPASRKRSNSIVSAGESTNAATSAPHATHPIPKLRKVKNTPQIPPKTVNTSPISGTVIRSPSESSENNDVIVIRRGDLDKSLNVVEVTEEARAGLAEIINKIGPYTCKLCKITFPDAFGLAGHNCSRIIHIEYQCPECGKSFHCPANLASHRRWHKPRPAPPVAKPATEAPPMAEVKTAENSTKLTIPRPDEVTFMQKTGNANIPFKKRFLLRKSEEPQLQWEAPVKAQSVTPPGLMPYRDLAGKTSVGHGGILLQEFQQHQCQICGVTIRGTQVFARHWQQCISANRPWTAVFLPGLPAKRN